MLMIIEADKNDLTGIWDAGKLRKTELSGVCPENRTVWTFK